MKRLVGKSENEDEGSKTLESLAVNTASKVVTFTVFRRSRAATWLRGERSDRWEVPQRVLCDGEDGNRRA